MKRLSVMAKLSYPVASDEDNDEAEIEQQKSSPMETASIDGVKIILNEWAIKSGTFLKGQVVVAQRNLTQVSSLTVTAIGLATSQFMSDDGKEYKARHEFLCEKMDLTNDLQNTTTASDTKQELHVAFQCRIPNDAPPSFTGTYGSITYECKAILKFTSTLARRRIRKVAFTVLPIRNNIESIQRIKFEPVSVSRTHRLTSLGIVDGEVDIRLRTDETNLKRGRTNMNILLELTNRTCLHLRDIRFGILLTTEWNAKGRRLIERVFIDEVRKDDICLMPDKDIRIQKQFGPIPTQSPPTVEFSDEFKMKNQTNIISPICKCSYTLFAKLIPPNFAKTCLVEIPLYVY